MYVWRGKEKTLSNLACGWPAQCWQTAVQTHCEVVRLCYRFISDVNRGRGRNVGVDVERKRSLEEEWKSSIVAHAGKSFPQTDGNCRIAPVVSIQSLGLGA